MFRSPSETNKENRLITTVNRGTEGVEFEPTVGIILPTLDFESSALTQTQPPFQDLEN